ncbi:MAG TPA: bifunctional hydroxymethylpyrimidine kinase/phosphomethylpyrimidine kinase, partial [Pyrinomonadaceae bacterium]|nr:bifunctional hydroxymethylpyrimidine kinase/phosphomethylpyrimidine kinase [Pyrinomonadaceae bacterium]
MTQKPVCLTIAGLDPSGGAGVIADVRTFDAFGCFPTAAITSVTFQNTTGVFGATHLSAEDVRQQIEPVLDDFLVAAVKTGMLPTREIIEVVADIIRERDLKNMVVDPVVRSTSGYDLIDNAALRVLVEQLFPLADLITPNIPEAERITGVAFESIDDIRAAADIMHEMGARNVLIKGGHFANEQRAVDWLFSSDREMQGFDSEFFDTTATHGTGCTLASAIAANLALGNNLADAVAAAKEFVTNSIRTAP